VQHTTLPTRREFTVATALAMLSGVTITIIGCGGSTTPAPPTGPSPAPGNVTGEISANHGHSAVVTRAQMTAGNELSLDIQGAADHPHTIVISQNALAAVANGQRVTVESTETQAHAHLVAFN
jgi:hypothetical protein